MGIPLAGLGYCKQADGLSPWPHDPAACWIARGAPILSYTFSSFRNASKSAFAFFTDDPRVTETFEIRSPISGMVLLNRDESTLGAAPGFSLQYQWCDERRLPVLLVPNDEPAPAADNFYVYDRIAQSLAARFDLLPYRDSSWTQAGRLKDWLAGPGAESAKVYEDRRQKIRGRKSDSYRSYNVREITDRDYELIRSVQDFRGNDLRLRDKLVHLSRKFAQST